MPKTNTPKDPVAILAGGGALPATLASHLIQDGKPVLGVSFAGQPQPIWPKGVTPYTVPLGAVRKTLKLLEQQHVKSVVLAGKLDKPSLFALRPDAIGMRLLGKALWQHDDALLRLVCDLLEQHGFQVVAPQQIAPQLLVRAGNYSRNPTKQEQADIALGLAVLKHTAPLDIGQAVIVKQRTVLGLEAIEGTDNLLERCANLRHNKSGGVLVKAAKPQQTQKADLPTIGLETIEKLVEFGYSGVAVQAGAGLLLQHKQAIDLARKNKIFLSGIEA